MDRQRSLKHTSLVRNITQAKRETIGILMHRKSCRDPQEAERSSGPGNSVMSRERGGKKRREEEEGKGRGIREEDRRGTRGGEKGARGNFLKTQASSLQQF